jgi:glycosidase
MVWNDIAYEDEHAAFDPAKSRPVDTVSPDTALKSFYVKLGRMRRENPVLVNGDLNFSLADDKKIVLAYNRTSEKEEIVVVFNRSDSTQNIKVPVRNSGNYIELLTGGKKLFKTSKGTIQISLEPLTAAVLKRD